MLGKWMKLRGLVHQLAPPDAHGQIGIAENKIKTLNDRMRVLMVSSGAPPNLGFHAIEMVNGIMNRTAHKGLPSPMEATGGEGKAAPYPKADFGQLAITVEPVKAPKNRPSRHIECAYLGPDWDSYDGCLLLRIDNGKVIRRRTVKFISQQPFLIMGERRPPSQTPLMRALEEFEVRRKRRLDERLDEEMAQQSGSIDGFGRDEMFGGEDGRVGASPPLLESDSDMDNELSDDSCEEDMRYNRVGETERMCELEDRESVGNEQNEQEDVESDDRETEFQSFNKYMQLGRQNNSKTHFTRSSNPVLSERSAMAAMEYVTKATHPKDFLAALNHPQSARYLEATRREMLAHHKNRSFEVISGDQLPPDANVINTGMIYTNKLDGLSSEEIIKARLCAKGYAKVYGVDFTDTTRQH